MRRHAKASSAGSTSGTGKGRARFRRAFATRGASSDADGSGAPSGRAYVALVSLLAFALVVLTIAPIAQAGKAVLSVFGTPSTGIAGKLNSPAGIAVNRTGVGGVGAGDFYVVDSGSNRIQQFSAAGAFVRSWGYDVVSSGQDNTGVNEKQTVTVNATGGTFSLTVTTASAAGLRTAGSNTITGVTNTLGSFQVGDLVVGAGIPANTTVTAVGAGTLTLSSPATAESAVEFTATETAAGIPFNVSAAALQSALEALPGIGAGGATVTGGPGATAALTIEFKGPLAGNDIAQATTNVTSLTGGAKTAPVATTVVGGGFEICNAVSSPADVCKKGTGVASAGGLFEEGGIAVDQATGVVYTVSHRNDRVDVFSPTGTFQGAFGWNVNASTPEEKLQFCTTATGCKAAVNGVAAGQLNSHFLPTQPAISPTTGNIYVPDPGNVRIGEYDPTLNGSNEVTGASFVRAIGWDVIPAINEKQTVTVSGATGGNFTLSFKSQTTTASGTGTATAGSNEITGFSASSGTFLAGAAISGAGIPAGATITAINTGVLTISASATATNVATPVTTALPFNASATLTQNALRALPGIGSPNVTVTGGPAGTAPLTVEFTGPFSGLDQPQMIADGSGLTGVSPSAGVATVQTGANGAGTGLEACTASTTCQKGVNTNSPGRFGSSQPNGVAVDAAGSVYAVNVSNNCAGGQSRCSVLKINAAATAAEEFAPSQLTTTLGTGTEGSNVEVAVDPGNGHVFVSKKASAERYRILEFSSSGALLDAFPPGPGILGGSGYEFQKGLAVGTGDRLYFASSDNRVQILAPPPAPTATIEPASAVGTTTATFNGLVKLATPGVLGGYLTFYRFEYSSNGITWTKFPAAEAALGDGSGSGTSQNCPTGNPTACIVSQAITGLQPNTSYAVRLVASNGSESTSTTTSFTTGAAVPIVSGVTVDPVGETTAKLTGLINPNNQPTKYRFEWGPTTSYGTQIPADFEPVVGSGGQPVKVTADLSGLPPETVYHFRIVATNPSGQVKGTDHVFETLNSSGLPDHRRFELVSPANKRPNGMVGDITIIGKYNLRFQPADDGESVFFPILNGLSDSTTGGTPRYSASRTAEGWSSAQVSPPSLVAPPETAFQNEPSHILYAPPSLDCAIVETYNPVSSDTPAVDVEYGVRNLYRWNKDGTYTLLSNRVPLNIGAITEFGASGIFYKFVESSRDCSRVYFKSRAQLLSGASGLYEWDEGTLRDAAQLPNGATPVGEARIGGEGEGTGGSEGRINAVSSDGDRFFFSATSNQGTDSGTRAVFAREDGGTSVVDVSQSKTAVPTKGARYELASSDGSHVFFAANYGIASTTSSGPTTANCAAGTGIAALACDLYDYDFETGELTDLSADTNPVDTNGAAMQGVVAIDDDGSHVYFAAMGQLIPNKGKTYAENTSGFGSANVYLAHDGQLQYVTTLAQYSNAQGNLMQAAGLPGASSNLVRNTRAWVARSSADGSRLLFVSVDSPTGYDSNGNQEAYMYFASSGEISCVSCHPDGSVPTFHPPQATQVISPLTMTTQEPDTVMSPVRSMNAAGTRVFFFSKEVLAPGATDSGFQFEDEGNLYEWADGQVYFLTTLRRSGTSAIGTYIGSSVDGRDVFVGTRESHSPEDIDSVSDVYNLRAGGGIPLKPEPPTPCAPALDQCQGPATPTPPSAAPPSSSFSGPSNPPAPSPSRACPKPKVRVKGKCVKKKQQGRHSKKRAAHAKRHWSAAQKTRRGAK